MRMIKIKSVDNLYTITIIHSKTISQDIVEKNVTSVVTQHTLAKQEISNRHNETICS